MTTTVERTTYLDPFTVTNRVWWQLAALVVVAIGWVLLLTSLRTAAVLGTVWAMVPVALLATVFAFLPIRRPVGRAVWWSLATIAVCWTLGAAIQASATNDRGARVQILIAGLALMTGSWVSAWTLRRVEQSQLGRTWLDVVQHAKAKGFRLRWILAVGGHTHDSARVLVQDATTGREENVWVWGTPVAGTWVVLTNENRIVSVVSEKHRIAYSKLVQRFERRTTSPHH